MRTSARLASAIALAITLISTGALAQDWVLAAGGSAGDVFEIDGGSVTRSGDVAQSWMRLTPARPQKDKVTGKTFAVSIVRRFDDCASRRYQFTSYLLRDTQGRTIASGTETAGWQDVVPGTVAESVWKTACRATAPPKEEPLLADIGDGQWTRLGASADNKYDMSLSMDRLYKVDEDHVLALTRSDYRRPEWVNGYAVRYMVNATLVDCKKGEFAPYGLDTYISPGLRAEAKRVPIENLSFQPASPGSFLFNALHQVCSEAKPFPKGDGAETEAAGEAVGTGWGTTKGYIVTASHVVANGKTIEVYSDGEKIGQARVVADDPANDLAVLKLVSGGARLQVLPLAERPASLGRSVFTLGYPAPDVLGQRVKMTAGEISATTGVQDDARYLQISVPIQPGNSGGPLIGWDGAVVGVIEAKLNRLDEEGSGPQPENVNYAMKASYLRPMLEDLPDLGNYTVVRAAGAPDEIVAAARKAVFMLVVTP